MVTPPPSSQFPSCVFPCFVVTQERNQLVTSQQSFGKIWVVGCSGYPLVQLTKNEKHLIIGTFDQGLAGAVGRVFRSESFRNSEMTDIAWTGKESPRAASNDRELRVLMKDKWQMFVITFTFKFQRFAVILSSTSLRDHTVSRTEVRLVTVVDQNFKFQLLVS